MFRKRSGQNSPGSTMDAPSTVWITEIDLNSRELRDAARRVGLGGSNGHVKLSLQSLERRRFQIRLLNVAVLSLVCIAMVIVSGIFPVGLPTLLSTPAFLVVIVGVAAVFGFWLFQKERQLRRLAQFVVDEQFHHDVVNRRLKVVETLLESSKAVNQGAGEKRAVETIVRQADQFFEPGRICFYGRGNEGDVKPVFGELDLGLEDLAQFVVRQEQSRVIRPVEGMSTHSFGVPVHTRKRVFGALCLKTTAPDIDSFETLMAMSLFAEQAAAAIANARAREREKLDESQRRFDRTHDAQTGLLTRTEFLARLDRRIAAYGDDAPRVGMVFLNIDGMKRINNGLGLDVGDAVIRHVGERLSDSLPDGAMAGHFGGDEFMVALPDVSGYVELEDLARTLSNAVGESLSVGARQVFFSASIGIAMPESFDTNARELVRNAHVAMQIAKAEGGGACATFDANLLDDADRTLDLEDEVRRALETGEIDIHVQPIFDLRSQRPAAVEVLGRWMHPERGAISAAAFIPFAKHAVQRKQIDLRVLEKACEAFHALRGRGHDIPIHVNLDTAHLASEDFITAVISAVESTGAVRDTFVIEVTDKDNWLATRQAADHLARLKDAGIRVTLDDFGGTTSSLQSLDNTLIDMVKVSRALVSNLEESGSARQDLVETVLSLGERMDLEVVATGVETDNQLEILKKLGCHLAQGYFLGKPLPLDAFLARYWFDGGESPREAPEGSP